MVCRPVRCASCSCATDCWMVRLIPWKKSGERWVSPASVCARSKPRRSAVCATLLSGASSGSIWDNLLGNISVDDRTPLLKAGCLTINRWRRPVSIAATELSRISTYHHCHRYLWGFFGVVYRLAGSLDPAEGFSCHILPG